MSGWIKLHRSLTEWEWYDDRNATRLLIHLLVRVNHADRKWHGEVIKSGSMITSWESMSAETGLTTGQARRAMKKLEASGEVVRVSTNKWQLITLLKWDKLQGGDDDEPKPIKPATKKAARKTVPKAQGDAQDVESNTSAVASDVSNAASIRDQPHDTDTKPPIENNMKNTKATIGAIKTMPTKKGPDFIDEVIALWRNKYREHRGHDYEIMAMGKERSSAGKLVALNKKTFPKLDKEQAMEKLAQTFAVCLTIEDNWLWKNMSMSIIVSRFNEIKNYVTSKKTGGYNGGPGITKEQRDEIVARVFAASPEQQQ